MADDDARPIAYTALDRGTAMLDDSGRQFGTVEHVLQIPEEDLFDGIVVATNAGLRFVDRDQIGEITTRYVRCQLTDEQVTTLPAPQGEAVFTVDALQDTGTSLHDRLGRMFRRPRWTREK